MNEAASRIRHEEDLIMEKLREKAVVVLICRIKSTKRSKPENKQADCSTKTSFGKKRRKLLNARDRMLKSKKNRKNWPRN